MTPVEAPTGAVRCVIWRDFCVTDRVLCQGEVLRNDKCNVFMTSPPRAHNKFGARRI